MAACTSRLPAGAGKPSDPSQPWKCTCAVLVYTPHSTALKIKKAQDAPGCKRARDGTPSRSFQPPKESIGHPVLGTAQSEKLNEQDFITSFFFFFFFKQWGVHTQLSILFDSKARHSITLCCNIVWAKSIKAFFQDYTFSSDSYVPIPTVSRESRIIERQREFHLITNTCLMSNSRLCYLPIYHMFHFHMRSRILLSSTIFSHV